MRESIGTTWTYMLVITFTLIFTGFLIIVMSFTKTYKVKNEMTTIIEKYEGLTKEHYANEKDSNGIVKRVKKDYGSINIINNYLKSVNYTTKWTCKTTDDLNFIYYGASDLDSLTLKKIDKTSKPEKYYYCLGINSQKKIVSIQVFFNFNVPILGRIGTFRVKGETNEMLNLLYKDVVDR